LKGSTDIMMGSLESVVKKVGQTAGKEAAEQVAKEGAGTVVKNLFDVFVGNPAKEGLAELFTFIQQKTADKAIGINNESTQKIIKDGINTWVLGAASQGVMTSPQMAVTAVASANKARKSFLRPSSVETPFSGSTSRVIVLFCLSASSVIFFRAAFALP